MHVTGGVTNIKEDIAKEKTRQLIKLAGQLEYVF